MRWTVRSTSLTGDAMLDLNRVRLVDGNAGAYAVECLSVDNAATAPGASWITEDERARGRMQGPLWRYVASTHSLHLVSND